MMKVIPETRRAH